MEFTANETANGQIYNRPNTFFLGLPLILSIILLITTFFKRRSRRDVAVNCWFCDQNLLVPPGNENCFDCPKCEQYNGFQEDGDYNKPIPRQQNEDLNYPVMGGPPATENQNYSWENGLCSQCNSNQTVKIRLLAAFQPMTQETEDEELLAYSARLEQLYRLCWRCRLHTQAVIERQNEKLAPLLPDSLRVAKDFPKQKTRNLIKFVSHAVILGELVCFLSSLCVLWWSLSTLQPALSINLERPALLKIQSALTFPFSLQTVVITCLVGALTTAATSVLDRVQKGIRSLTVRLVLWLCLLMWTYQEHSPSFEILLCSLFPGDRILTCILLGVVCLANLLKSLTYKDKQPRIQKRTLKGKVTPQVDEKAPAFSSVANWLSSCDQNRPLSEPSTFSLNKSDVVFPTGPFNDGRPKLSHAFGKMHITSSKLYTLSPSDHAVGYELAFRKNCVKSFCSSGKFPVPEKPGQVLRPAQFLPPVTAWGGQSVSQSSWVAGGLWSSPIGSKAGSINAPFTCSPVSAGFLTPPPSLDGSQYSQPDSMYRLGLDQSSQSAYKDCRLSWPPSHSSSQQRISPPSTKKLEPLPSLQPNRNQSWQWLPTLKKVAIAFSVSSNVILLVYLVLSQMFFSSS